MRERSPFAPGRSRRLLRLWSRLPAVLSGALAGIVLAVQAGCGGPQAAAKGRRVIILGYDGMDYGLATKLMSEGRMPNFSRLAKEGTFAPLGTSIPPQSPVAWSNFITGMDAGGHGIFDFMHRDPRTMLPYLSTSRAAASEKSLTLGRWKVPLAGGTVELLRRGEAFWEALEAHGVPTTIIRMPANFPPSGTASRELAGMGTPDILGTYGTFSFYTTKLLGLEEGSVGGGEIHEIFVKDHTVTAGIYGPDNPFLAKPEKVRTDFTLYVDPEEPAAKLVVGEEQRVLKEGEWSDWVPIEFTFIPTQSVRGVCRFYLKQVRPEVELYVSPVNIDPRDPALPISTPASYAGELAEATGLFYTQGMPEDAKALQAGVFSRDEYLTQARFVGEANIRQYKYVLDRFDQGLLFYYFGSLDQTSHVMWRPLDPEHPAYDPEIDPEYRDVIPALYQRLDEVVGYTLERMGEDTTLVVMSDHGFASWRRAFHLNGWLRANAYLEVHDPDLIDDTGLFVNVDWSRTRAYGLGFNGLYVNLQGREAWGIVTPQERRPLMEEMAKKLLETIDPATGTPAIAHVYIAEDVYRDRGQLQIGPDLIVGWAKGVRCSDESALGAVPRDVFADNTGVWSGDHLMDPEAVPGVLLTSRHLKKPAPKLEDVAAAVFAEFGIEGFPTSRSSAAPRE